MVSSLREPGLPRNPNVSKYICPETRLKSYWWSSYRPSIEEQKSEVNKVVPYLINVTQPTPGILLTVEGLIIFFLFKFGDC